MPFRLVIVSVFVPFNHAVLLGLRNKGHTNIKGFANISFSTAFSALTLLVGQQEGHPACKKLSGGVLAWLSV